MDTEAKFNSVKPAATFGCTVCQSSFTRLEHLQRHTTASHSRERPFPCTFCEQSFARRDVLMRHLKSCKSRASSIATGYAQNPPTSRRGRKRRSCDTCVRLKRSCSGTQPCLNCMHRKQNCHFTSSRTLEMSDQESKNEQLWLTPGSNESAGRTFEMEHNHIEASGMPSQNTFHNGLGSSPPTENSASRLAFLANLTSPHGMADTFDCGTIEERTRVLKEATVRNKFNSNFAMSHGSLTSMADEIALNIRNVFVDRHDEAFGMQWTANIDHLCSEFFNPVSLEQNLLAYFTLWHHNCPIIHKGTFELQNTPATLVAVMGLIGACVSTFPGRREASLQWLDPVERWVFSAPEFRDDPLPIRSDLAVGWNVQQRLDALKAGYCMILLQSWEGTEAAKRRARRSRYTEIIGVFRSLCGNEITHGDLNTYLTDIPCKAKWKAFALTEELIRTSTYVFLLDSAYAMFNNTPPRMALREARMALTCPEYCFVAETVEDWIQAMRIWAASDIGLRQNTLAQATSVLYLEQIPLNEWIPLQQLSCLNMFALIHLLHVQLFHMRCHPMPDSQTRLQRLAIDNWKWIWDQRRDWATVTESATQKTGFYKYAPEFWCLADHILASSEAALLTGFDQSTAVNGNLVAQLLSRYDESDMSQAHDLVNLFGSLSLEL